MIHTLQAVWGARTAAELKCFNAAYDGHKPVKRRVEHNLKITINKEGKAMKKFIEILTDEKKSFELPGWALAIIMPVVLVLLMGIAGWMDTHGM